MQRCDRWRQKADDRYRGCKRHEPSRWQRVRDRYSRFVGERCRMCRGSCINLNREKNVAYSSQRINFVNAFNYTPRAAHPTIERKSVDSSMLREKPRPLPCLAGRLCGKTEEGSGKIDRRFLVRKSRKMAR